MISSAECRYSISFTSPALLIHPFSPHLSPEYLTVKRGWDFTCMKALEWLSICIDMLHTPSSACGLSDSLFISHSLNCTLSHAHFSILLFLILTHLLLPPVLRNLFLPYFRFYLFNSPFFCPSQPVWMFFLFLPGCWESTCHPLSWSPFVFFLHCFFLKMFFSSLFPISLAIYCKQW